MNAPDRDISTLEKPLDDAPSEGAEKRTHSRFRLICLLLAFATLGVYSQVRQFDFVSYDDHWIIRDNPHLQGGLTWDNVVWAFTDSRYDWWHPVTWLSHMLDCQLFGMNPGPPHLTNVLLHTANVLLLFTLLVRMTGAVWQSGFVAAMFALHPLHVESVAWVTERKDVLSTFFLMLTLWAYWRWTQRPSPRGYLLTLLWFVLGLMSKPMLVTLPFALLLLDYWPLRRFGAVRLESTLPRSSTPIPRLLLEKVPFLLLAIASSVITFIGQHNVGGVTAVPILARILNALLSYVTYLRKMIWPSDLAFFYPYPGSFAIWKVLAALAILASVTVFVLRWARRHPYLPVGWFWYLGTLLPVIGLIQVGERAMADRFAYVPLIGIYIMLAWAVPELLSQRRTARAAMSVAAGAAILSCLILTWFQVQGWRNSISLYEHALKVTKNNYIAENNLGVVLFEEGKTEQASEHYRQAIRHKHDFEYAHVNLANALAQQGKPDEALAHYQEALRTKPDFADGLNALGAFLLQQGKNDEAVPLLLEALRLHPDHPQAHYNLGLVLSAQGKLSEAMAHYAEAVRLKSDYVEAHYNLGVALFAQGKPGEAMKHLSEAVQLKPEYVEAHNNLGLALAALGQTHQAIEHYTKALRLKPTHEKAHYNLGVTLSSQGNLDGAVMHYREAVRLKPEYVEARNNLGLALAAQGKLDEAITQYREAIRVKPDSVSAHFNFGLALGAQGKVDEAIAQFNETLRLRPDLADAHLQLAVLFSQQRNIEKALAHSREALRLQPKWPLATNHLAWLLATTDDPIHSNPAEAVQLAEQVVKASRDPAAEAFDTLAAAYAAAGRFREAVETAQRAIQLAQTADRRDLASQIQSRLERYQRGLAFRQNAAGPNPDS